MRLIVQELIDTSNTTNSKTEISGLEELIVDLLVQDWIKEQNKMKEDKIECHPEASKQAT